MSAFKVESGIPIPAGGGQGSKRGGKRAWCVYPWHTMNVGDSFAVPKEKAATCASAANFQSHVNGKRFTVRKHAGGYRCWRTA